MAFSLRRGFGRGDLAALAAGALLTLAFAPFSYAPLALLAPALLFYLWDGVSPRRAAWRGLLFGLGHYAGGVYWVAISLHSYGRAPLLFALLATALLVVYMALYPALLGYLLNRFFMRPRLPRLLLAAPALWTLLEWIRSWLLSGFPWLTLGYSQTDTPLAALAPLLGVFGVSGTLVLMAGLVVVALDRRGARRWLGLAALFAAAGAAAWLSGLRWATPSGAPLRVALIQGNVEQLQKFRPDALRRSLELYLERSRDVAADHDVIIWPETAIPVFIDQLDDGFVAALLDHGARTRTDYVSGIPAGDRGQSKYYNAVIGLSDGAAPAFYYKRRLVPFGEFLPFRALFDLFHHFVDIPMADFSRGAERQPLFAAGGQPVGVSICFEAAFGSEIRRALPRASWLINLSNDGWFGDSLAPHQHLQMARMRTLETARPMARATNTGITALIDHRAVVTARADSFEVATLSGSVQPMQGVTPYVRFGDAPALALSGVLLLAAGWRRRP